MDRAQCKIKIRHLECRSEEAWAFRLIIRNEESNDSGDDIGLT